MPHIHFHHHHGRRSIPKGYLAMMVGQGGEQQRFVMPVMYVNHPLFTQLLKASEEYVFLSERSDQHPLPDRQGDGRAPRLHHHHHQFLCFKA
ncbi:auxin-responsive protein SAUR32-like [Salvia splendens]|uniref:auxin-responsive protein SAUR32-like n=1 Tax=Salvia splendens TaxID=180675 RepID=UPI001C27BB6D|nr:auxin-responsive protein SAUR32-like [Salvia splendens]